MSFSQEVCILANTIRMNKFSQPALKEAYEGLPETKNLLETKDKTKEEVIKLKAEVCCLLGETYKGSDKNLARKLATESIELYKSLDIQTLEEAAPIFWEKMNYSDNGVVEQRFKDIL